MPSSLSSIAAKDGATATIVGGILAVDKSGAGNGPFFQAQTIVDTQGVNTATVKAASTAVASGDTAVAVGLHPTSPLPAGTNVIGHVIVDNANVNGRALPAASAPVVLNSQTYKACPASATTLLGATGATGDYLDGVLIIPGTAAAGVVQLQDGSGAAITIFAGGGTTALPTLAPFYVPIGAISSGGAGGWKVITNANVTAVGVGNFT